MNTIETTAGRAYAGHPEYDVLRGRKIGEFTVERKDKRRNCTVITTYEVIDIGRPDPIAPNDPDAAMVYEPWDVHPGALKQAWQARKEQAKERHDTAQKTIVAYLAEHGPSPYWKLIEITGENKEFIKKHLRLHKGTVYEHFVATSPKKLWGLIGQARPKRMLPKYVIAICDALREHGPLTAVELGAVLNVSSKGVRARLRRHDDIFVEVGSRRSGTGMAATFGLVGIHDTQNTENR